MNRFSCAVMAAISAGLYRKSDMLFQLKLAGETLSQTEQLLNYYSPIFLGIAVLSTIAAVMPSKQ